MKILTIQNNFQNYLLYQDDAIKESIVGDDLQVKQLKLNIYGESYRLRLQQLLSNDFPAFKNLLGESSFTHLIEEYIETYPPTHFSPRYLGQHLLTFLQENKIYSQALHWQEIVKWEWLLLEILDVANLPALEMSELTGIPPEQWPDLRFKLHPSVKLINLYYNVPQIWRSVQEGKTSLELIKADMPINYVVWRDQQFRICFQANTAEQQYFIEALQAEKTFAEIGDELCGSLDPDTAGQHAASLLREGLEQKILTKILFAS